MTNTVRNCVVALIALCATACGQADPLPEVTFRIVTAPGDDPWRGANELVLAVEQSGLTLQSTSFPMGTTSLPFGPLAFGRSLTFRVDAVEGNLVLARGRSFPFDFDRSPPVRRPDVLVARVGLFVAPLVDAPSSPVVAAIATSDGALIATAVGDLLRFTSHDAALDGASSLRVVAHVPGRAGAVWADLGGDLVLAVGGASGGATLYDLDGTELARVASAELAEQQIRPAVATLRRDQAVLVLGGAPAEAATPVATVTRIEVVHDGATVSLRATREPAMPEPRAGAAAIAVPIQPDISGGVTRVVVLGGEGPGGAIMSATSIDPAGSALAASIDLGTDAREAGIAVLSTGLVLIAGGVDAAGAPVGDLRILNVRASSLELVSPTPQPLVPARAKPAVAAFGPGLVLVAGGRGASGPVARADLYEVSLDNFPGDWVATGSLPLPYTEPRAVRLGDGTVLVAGAEGVAIWIPSRGP